MFCVSVIFNFQFSIFNCNAQQSDTALLRPPASTLQPQSGHSANRALLLSLLPGAGQVYNRQAWKVPIIYGAFATVGYFIHYNYTRMDMFKTEYLFRVNNPGERQLEGYTNYPDQNIYNLYNSYNRNFQLMVIIAAGVYALNLIDAYVFGHLFDFQIDDNLAMTFTPSLAPLPSGLHPTVGLTFSF